MALTTIARFRNPVSAHIARARLEAEGIPAFLADEHLVGVQWLYSDAVGGVKLNVPGPYAEAAREVVARDHSRDLRDVLRRRPLRIVRRACPACGAERSTRTTRARGVKRFVLFTTRRKCSDCGVEW